MTKDLRDLYGKCKLTAEKCSCLNSNHPMHVGWLGRLCPNWIPLGPSNTDELLQHFKENKS